MDYAIVASLKLAKETEEQLSQIREDLQPSPHSPQHLDLRSRVGQLTEQVADYTGRPAAAQEEYLGVFQGELDQVEGPLNSVIRGQLGPLNARFAADHVPYISPHTALVPDSR
ncbi:MAG TPA: hypothetical protein VNE63_17265 [Candidatus Acidoferrales bacterium]|nr:hypothetical protein [Candidatus Acidoferrales bacterium]